MSELDEIMDILNLGERLNEAYAWICHGPLHRFYVRRDGGWSGYLVENFLLQYRIPLWGRGFTRDCLYFSVKRKQANWAEYLMKRRGIPVASAPVNPMNDVYPQRHVPGSTPPRWEERSRPSATNKSSLLDTLLSFLDGK